MEKLQQATVDLTTELETKTATVAAEAQQALEAAVGGETSARVQMDTERLESMQRRFTAHEQLVQARVKDVDARVAMALQSSAQTLEAELSARHRALDDRMGLMETSTREQLNQLSASLGSTQATTTAKLEEATRERERMKAEMVAKLAIQSEEVNV